MAASRAVACVATEITMGPSKMVWPSIMFRVVSAERLTWKVLMAKPTWLNFKASSVCEGTLNSKKPFVSELVCSVEFSTNIFTPLNGVLLRAIETTPEIVMFWANRSELKSRNENILNIVCLCSTSGFLLYSLARDNQKKWHKKKAISWLKKKMALKAFSFLRRYYPDQVLRVWSQSRKRV